MSLPEALIWIVWGQCNKAKNTPIPPWRDNLKKRAATTVISRDLQEHTTLLVILKPV